MYGDEKLVPNITHVFRRNQNLYVTFDVYDARPDPANAKARRVKVSMSLFNQEGAKAFEIGPLDATQLADTRPEAVPVKFQVPLKDLAPGRYTARSTCRRSRPKVRLPTRPAGHSAVIETAQKSAQRGATGWSAFVNR